VVPVAGKKLNRSVDVTRELEDEYGCCGEHTEQMEGVIPRVRDVIVAGSCGGGVSVDVASKDQAWYLHVGCLKLLMYVCADCALR